MNAKSGDSKKIHGPTSSLSLLIEFKEITNSPEIRSIFWGQATYSSDTRLYFEISEPEKFSITDMGYKIKDKLSKQQAGISNPGIIRILMLNLAMTDTTDLLFFNETKYHSRFEKDILYLASDIEPYPPYDLVMPCELRPEAGFIKPVNLSTYDDNFIADILTIVFIVLFW